MGDAVGRGEFAAVTWALVVVENDLLIELGEIARHSETTNLGGLPSNGNS